MHSTIAVTVRYINRPPLLRGPTEHTQSIAEATVVQVCCFAANDDGAADDDDYQDDINLNVA